LARECTVVEGGPSRIRVPSQLNNWWIWATVAPTLRQWYLTATGLPADGEPQVTNPAEHKSVPLCTTYTRLD